ncbi:filaggrin-2-like isoform X3 [Varroa destructor]|uniref:Uncharacterized protein n=1 Tax=Varroa destructor TaxID=109461 RepID=A0A7M7KDD2_VARDE|nr:filaggrin-2-like isoform X3 [Varroa destructor]
MARLYLLGAMVLIICQLASLQVPDRLSSSHLAYAGNDSGKNINTELSVSSRDESFKPLLGFQSNIDATQNVNMFDLANITEDGRMDQSVVSINGAVNLDDLVTFDMESTLVTNATDETRVHFQEPIGNSPYHICGFHVFYLRRSAKDHNETFDVVSDFNHFGDLHVSSVDLEPVVNGTSRLPDELILFSLRNTTGELPELHLREVWLMGYDRDYADELATWLDTCPNRNPEGRNSGGQGYRVAGTFGGRIQNGGYVRFKTPGPAQTYYIVQTRPGYPVLNLKTQPIYRTVPVPITYRKKPGPIVHSPLSNYGQGPRAGYDSAQSSSSAGEPSNGFRPPQHPGGKFSIHYGSSGPDPPHGGYQPQQQHFQGYGPSSSILSISSITSGKNGNTAPQRSHSEPTSQASYAGSASHNNGSVGGTTLRTINKGSNMESAAEGSYAGDAPQNSYGGSGSQGSHDGVASQGSHSGSPPRSSHGASALQIIYAAPAPSSGGYGNRAPYPHQVSAGPSTPSYVIATSGQYVAGPNRSMPPQQGYGQAQASASHAIIHMTSPSSSSYSLTSNGGHGPSSPTYTVRSSGAGHQAALTYNAGVHSPSQEVGSGYTISGGYAGAAHGAQSQGTGYSYSPGKLTGGQSYGSLTPVEGHSYRPSNPEGEQFFGPSNQTGGYSYGPSNQGGKQSYGPSNQFGGHSYKFSTHGREQPSRPSNQGGGQSYEPAKQTGGQSYVSTKPAGGHFYGFFHYGGGQMYGPSIRYSHGNLYPKGQRHQAGYQDQSGNGYSQGQGPNSGPVSLYGGHGGSVSSQKPHIDGDSGQYMEFVGSPSDHSYRHQGGRQGHEYSSVSLQKDYDHYEHSFSHGYNKTPYIRSNSGHGSSGGNEHYPIFHGYEVPYAHSSTFHGPSAQHHSFLASHGHGQASYSGGQSGAGYNNQSGGSQNYGQSNGRELQQGFSYGPQGTQQQNHYWLQTGKGEQKNYGLQPGPRLETQPGPQPKLHFRPQLGSQFRPQPGLQPRPQYGTQPGFQPESQPGPQSGLQPGGYGPPQNRPQNSYRQPGMVYGPPPALVAKTEIYEDSKPEDYTTELVKLLAKLPPATLVKLLPPLKAKLKAEKSIGLSAKIAKLIAKVAILITKGKKVSDDQMVKLADLTVEVNKLLDDKADLNDLNTKLIEFSKTIQNLTPDEGDPDCVGDSCLALWNGSNSTDIITPLTEFMKGAYLRLIETQDDARTTLTALKEQLTVPKNTEVLAATAPPVSDSTGDVNVDDDSRAESLSPLPNENDPSFAFISTNPADAQNIKAGDTVSNIADTEPEGTGAILKPSAPAAKE